MWKNFKHKHQNQFFLFLYFCWLLCRMGGYVHYSVPLLCSVLPATSSLLRRLFCLTVLILWAVKTCGGWGEGRKSPLGTVGRGQESRITLSLFPSSSARALFTRQTTTTPRCTRSRSGLSGVCIYPFLPYFLHSLFILFFNKIQQDSFCNAGKMYMSGAVGRALGFKTTERCEGFFSGLKFTKLGFLKWENFTKYFFQRLDLRQGYTWRPFFHRLTFGLMRKSRSRFKQS